MAFLTLAATIMWVAPIAVNGEGVSFTETISSEQAKKGRSLKELVSSLTDNGEDDTLTPGVGPMIDLQDRVAIKLLTLRPNEPHWKERYCDLVFTKTDPILPPHPHCFVMMDTVKTGRDVRFVNFRFDLTGRLLAASQMLAKDDENGKPIRGSATKIKLDITDPKVLKEANSLMDFWRLGRYKKYLAAPAKPSK